MELGLVFHHPLAPATYTMKSHRDEDRRFDLRNISTIHKYVLYFEFFVIDPLLPLQTQRQALKSQKLTTLLNSSGEVTLSFNVFQ